MAAAGAGGLESGVVSVVAGTTTPLQAATVELPSDPQQHPWVSAHLRSGTWAVETNAGYTGMSYDWLASIADIDVSELAAEAATSTPGAAGVTAAVTSPLWSESTWSERAPAALIGFEPGHRRADLARAFLEAHAYAIRGNLEDLERALGAPATQICLAGGAARSPAFAQLVADVVGRPLTQVAGDYPTGRAFAWLAARAAGDAPDAPGAEGRTIEPEDHAAYGEGYGRFVRAGEVVQDGMGGWLA